MDIREWALFRETTVYSGTSEQRTPFGSGTIVLCWEVVLISEVPIEMYFTPQIHDSEAMYCLPSDIILFHCNQSHMMLNKKLRCTEIVGDGCLFGGSQLQCIYG